MAPTLKLKEGASPREARYAAMAVTGQRSLFVTPTKIAMPCRKGSVFDAFIFT